MIVQFGGQTPLNLSLPLKAAGVPIIGTSPESIDLAEDRKRFGKLLEELDIPQAPGAMATSVEEAVKAANRIGYPVLVRPSYVLGGRAMVIAYDEETVTRYMKEAVEYSQDRPILIDKFLEDAIEVDVDALPTVRMSSSVGSCSTSKRQGFTPATLVCVARSRHPRRLARYDA